jgi:hypothetical protein
LQHARVQQRWIVAVPSDLTADGPILAGHSVLPMGGFYGTDPAMTRTRLANLVARDQLRFVDVGGFTLGDTNQMRELVTQACRQVSSTVWHATGPSTLYDCRGRQYTIRTVKLRAQNFSGPGGVGAGNIKLGPAAAVQRLIACFRNNGWNPTPNPDLSSPVVRKALAACQKFIPAAVPGVRLPA